MTELEKLFNRIAIAHDEVGAFCYDDQDVQKLLAICKIQREALSHIKSCSRCHFYHGECNALIDIEMKYNAIISELK